MTPAAAIITAEEAPRLRHCPACKKDLAIDAFGVDRSRPDGRNPCCKSCIRQRVNKSREGARNYKHEHQMAIARKRRVTALQSPAPRRKLTLEEKVLNAVIRGSRTQTEIALRAGDFSKGVRAAFKKSYRLVSRLLRHEDGVTLTASEAFYQEKLLTDELGKALASLLDEGSIRTASVNGKRVYLPNLRGVPVVSQRQMSLFQLSNQFGPTTGGVSARLRGLAEKREAPETWKAPARSRVA